MSARFVSRALTVTAVVAGTLLAPAAAAPVPSGSQDASAILPTDRPPTAGRCSFTSPRSRCHVHDYKVTITVHATAADLVAPFNRETGDATITLRAPLRVVPKEARGQGRQPESTQFFSPDTKLVKSSGSGTQSGPECVPSWKLPPPDRPESGGHVGGFPSLIRGGKRTYRYQLDIVARAYSGLTQPPNCSMARLNFFQVQRSFDVRASIDATWNFAGVELQLGFPRWQRAGKLEFPLNRLEEHKGFVLNVKGSYESYGIYATGKKLAYRSSGTARIVFEPVGS